MAVFWRAITGGVLLALLGWGAESQDNRAGKQEVSGSVTVNLGQERDIWRPLIHTTVNVTEIRSIKSSFQFRTFDPEGAIFYGDTKNGEDWFVLALKDGIPLMQISKEGMLFSAAGGPKLNDGKWHTLEVSNHGKFVILDVDGSTGLVVGMQSKKEEVLSGKLRLALGGMLIDPDQLIVQFEPQMDGCVRGGSWLNLTVPWEAEAEELWSCYQDVKPGSHFPGTGFAIFNTSVFPITAEDGLSFEIWGNFSNMDGTIFSLSAPGHQPLVALVANKSAQEFRLTFGKVLNIMPTPQEKLVIHLHTDWFQVKRDIIGSGFSSTGTDTTKFSRSYPLTGGHVAFGGLLGGDEGNIRGSHFLTGCVEKIKVQGRDVDLDLAVKHSSISSHSCPT